MAWGSNSVSSSRSSFRSSPFSDFGSYMDVKNRKLQDQFAAEASTSSHGPSSSGKPIFNGVSIFVDGYTVPPSQELKGYMLKYGGKFENYFSRRRVTHIICSNLPDSKIKNLRSFSRGLPVVKPTWVLDSVAADKLLSWIPYQLEQVAGATQQQPKLSSFFTIKGSPVSHDEATCTTNQSFEDERIIESNLLEEDECIANSTDESLEGERIMESKNVLEEGESSENPQQYSGDSSSRCVDDKKIKESSDSAVVGPSYHRHSTLVDSNFVENYFKNSRLHFIGTWRNRYRKRFPNISNGFKCSSSNPDSSNVSQNTTIIHLDMDCFFVSVVIRNHPELRDKPVAVCHSDNPRGTSEISSANYPARDHGIKAGIFVRDAKALCPHLVILPYNFEAYEEVADQFYDILHKHCDKVQAVSCDEAFIDVTNSSLEDPENLASIIRKEIFETTKCTASAGISGNMLMARLATRTAKPDGQCYIHPDKVHDYLDELPIKALPGIGHVLEEKLKRTQIQTCGQLRAISKESLRKDFGSKTGDMLWSYSRGIDNRLVGVIQESKSIGADVNWGVRFNDMKDCKNFLSNLCKEVSLRLQGCGVQGRTFTLKVKKRMEDAGEPVKYMGCGACENLSHSTTVPVPTDDVDVLQRITNQLFGNFYIDVKDIRGMGLQVSKLETVDTANQGLKTKSIRSWLVSQSPSNRQNCRVSSPRKETANREPEERQNDRNQDSNVPPLQDLDIEVISSLPPELFSEINNIYGGKLISLIAKTKGKNVVGIGSSHPTSFGSFEGLTTVKKESEEKLSEAGPSSLGVSHSAPERFDIMPCSLSQIDKSVLQELPEEVRIDVLGHLPVHRNTSECTTSDALGTNHGNFHPPGECDSSRRNTDLWIGNPPKWVEEFEKSNYWILNIFAELYYKSGSTDKLSDILLRTITISQLPVGANNDDGWDEAIGCFCALIKEYIKFRIDTDIEEIYDCFRLLKRLAKKSTFFLQVYSTVLPEFQAAVSEKYGGNFDTS